jgi:hypothetical protein
VVKGTAIDISKIPWGDYVLAITVRDNVTGQKSSTAVAFRRTDGEDRLRL